MVGASGTIGKATLAELQHRGHEVVCFGRSGNQDRIGDVTNIESITNDGFRAEPFDAVVSCLASRNGLPRDAEKIDHIAHSLILRTARKHGVKHFVLLSAICVQKPKLIFQHAKLAFEAELIESGLSYSIVRPTAYFKSLSGQVNRVLDGKPYLLFGNGELTSCKPISDYDLACFMANCLEQPALQNQILPIGGPGPAMSPLQQGEALFHMLGRPPKFRKVPLGLLNFIITILSLAGKLSTKLAEKAELARIGHYYASESMLVWNNTLQQYDADATPSFGSETLLQFQAKLIRGETKLDLGEHAVF